MTSKQLTYGILRAVGILVLIGLLLYFLWSIRAIFAYLAVAFVLTMIGRPLMYFLHRRLKVPNFIAAVIVLLLFIGFFAGFINLFVRLVLNQPIHFTGNLSDFDNIETAVTTQLEGLSESIGLKSIPFLGDFLNDLVSNLNFKGLSSVFGSSLTVLSKFLLDAFAVFFITFFFLKDRYLFNKMVRTFAPEGEENRFENVFNQTKDLLSRYFIGLLLQVIVMFIFYISILLAFDIRYAAVIALICALFNLIPYLGPVLGAVVISSLSLSNMYGMGLDFNTVIVPKLLWIMFWYLLAQAWDNFINQPLIYSHSVKSNPLEIFLVILIGGFLFGVVGVLVAVPTYTVIRVILKEFLPGYKLVQSITKNI